MTLYALGTHAPDCHADTWVAPDANLIGKVVLEQGASVWFGTTIRADHEEIRIGQGSNVQENCVFHIDDGYPMVIGSGCTIGHKVMLHGCTIADNTLIGIGSTILNNAVIPENCIVGAQALVTEGKTFEPGSLIIGAPARAVKTLDDDAIAMIRRSADVYVTNAARFAKDLNPL